MLQRFIGQTTYSALKMHHLEINCCRVNCDWEMWIDQGEDIKMDRMFMGNCRCVFSNYVLVFGVANPVKGEDELV